MSPAIKALFNPDRSKTDFKMVQFTDDDALLVFATNTGTKDSFLLSASFEFRNTSQAFKIKEDVGDRTILPGKYRTFTLQMDELKTLGATREELSNSAHVNVTISGTKEGETPIEVTPNQSALSAFIKAKTQ